MRNLLIMFSTAVILFSSVGCTEKSNVEEENEQISVNTNEQEQSEQTNKHPSELAFEFMKANMSLGIDKQAVTGLLGTNFKEIQSEDGVIWRYNVGADTYVSDDLSLVTKSDYDAIKNGEINVIVFINWKKDLVDSYSIYYFERDLNIINEYVVSADGETAKQVTN
ncbi:hypothetical protein CIB95_01835 [Lottiidibacillus patelloidae]|uniref:Lipoprotein n=1 Tax=Lottiidibacillus patelloidae TaxID=2670334 RepID=A0A263BX87_9BACI|nr:hypothetical protein [Lottiidibacillus patelloidae]OZM58335.1 hypothetical protein CIB95_01835 [Lottiidibacillus patelloidae]